MRHRAGHAGRIIPFLSREFVSGIGRCFNRNRERAFIAGTYLLLLLQARP